MTSRLTAVLVGLVLVTPWAAGCRSPENEGAGSDPAASEESAAGLDTPDAQDVPDSMVTVVGSLPESSVRVIDPAAGSRADRIEELADSVGAAIEGDTARIVVEDSVLFEFGSAELLESASEVLDDIAALLADLNAEEIAVVGHTDAVGTEEFNLELSALRAAAVEGALVDRGVDGGVIAIRGEGEADPVAPNENADGSDNPDGRARNRRVEITATGIAVDGG